MGMTLREDAPDEAGALAVAVGHAWDGTSCTCAFAVEEDEEDERADKGKTSNDTDDNAGDGASTQLGASRSSAGTRAIETRSRARRCNSDGLHLAASGSGLLDDASGGGCIRRAAGLNGELALRAPPSGTWNRYSLKCAGSR